MNTDTGTWGDDAACKGHLNLFYPTNYRHHSERAKTARALAICNRCTVIEQCRTYGIHSFERYGIWGGLTPDELRTERDRLGITPTNNTTTHERSTTP